MTDSKKNLPEPQDDGAKTRKVRDTLRDTVAEPHGVQPDIRNTLPEPHGAPSSPPSAEGGAVSTRPAKMTGSPLVETVMVVDICGSTEIGSRYGDQMLMRLNGAFGEIALAAAQQQHATFSKGTGDGFMMTFAQCGQAVSAAQDILKEMRRYNTAHPDQPSVGLRFGIHHGEVYADPSGDRRGNAVNLAFRVQDTKVENMHETKQGISKEQLPRLDRIFVTHNVFKELSTAGSPFACLKLGYFDYKGFEGMRMAIYEIMPAMDT